MGCDVTSVIGILAIIVSIHAPTWGATSRYFRKYCGYGVSIHAPTWGATYEQRRISETAALFQSTHPHGVRLHRAIYFTRRSYVSIHAPTWGATMDYRTIATQNIVSIHAPTWGATPSWSGKHHGLIVSIHAPTWGATLRSSGKR